MPKTLPGTAIPEDFQLTEKTIARVEQSDFSVDIPKTLNRFILKAESHGWIYKNWQSAFLNYVANGKDYGGVEYKIGRAADPRWLPILAEAKPYGFRDPLAHETPGSYRTEFEQWKRIEKRDTPNFAAALRAVK